MNTELVEAALSAHGRRLVVLDSGEVTDDWCATWWRLWLRCVRGFTVDAVLGTGRLRPLATRSAMSGRRRLSVAGEMMPTMNERAVGFPSSVMYASLSARPC
jgi:hypothetical protein